MAGLGFNNRTAAAPQRGLGLLTQDEEDDLAYLEDEFFGAGQEGEPFDPRMLPEVDPDFIARNQDRLRRAWEAGRARNQRPQRMNAGDLQNDMREGLDERLRNPSREPPEYEGPGYDNGSPDGRGDRPTTRRSNPFGQSQEERDRQEYERWKKRTQIR